MFEVKRIPMEKGGTYFIYVQKGDNVYKILSIYKKEKAKASDVMLKKGTYFKGEIIGFYEENSIRGFTILTDLGNGLFIDRYSEDRNNISNYFTNKQINGSYIDQKCVLGKHEIDSLLITDIAKYPPAQEQEFYFYMITSWRNLEYSSLYNGETEMHTMFLKPVLGVSQTPIVISLNKSLYEVIDTLKSQLFPMKASITPKFYGRSRGAYNERMMRRIERKDVENLFYTKDSSTVSIKVCRIRGLFQKRSPWYSSDWKNEGFYLKKLYKARKIRLEKLSQCRAGKTSESQKILARMCATYPNFLRCCYVSFL